MALFSILAIMCSYGNYHFGALKDKLNSQQTKGTSIVINKIDSSAISKNEHKPYAIVKETIVPKKEIINAPNALINTQHQSGGTNIVNYNGEKLNPANILQKPIFNDNGNYGLSILSQNLTNILKETPYSFSANIPVNTILKVTLSKLGDDKQPSWAMKVGSEKNWRYNPYKEGEQEFNLDEGLGDLLIIFSGTGAAKMKIYFNNDFLSEKIITWN
jgi:hypothetical protein